MLLVFYNKSMQKSFLRWPGSKLKLLSNILPHTEGSPTLAEPFVGSGTVFLNSDNDRYVISDIDPDLMAIFHCLKHNPQRYMRSVERIFTTMPNTQEAYKKVVKRFNASKDPYRRAVLLHWINRHCFNGLFRKNLKGEFNVPFGRVARPHIVESAIDKMIPKLKRTRLNVGGFETISQRIRPCWTIYNDPPYSKLTATSSFAGYQGGGFSDALHVSLVDYAQKWQARGAKVLISNHDTEYTRALYANATQLHSLSAYRSLSAKASTRRSVPELLVEYRPH